MITVERGGKRLEKEVFRPDQDESRLKLETVIIFGARRGAEIRKQQQGEYSTFFREGLPVGAIERLFKFLGVSNAEGLPLLSLTSATYSRRKGKGKLDSTESDRVYRYAKLSRLATEMFHGDKEAARGWLKTPAHAFKGETPLERARTEYGVDQVEQLIGRIRHGIPT